MKKLILFALASIFFLTLSFAGNNPELEKNKTVLKIIKKELKYPSFIQKKQLNNYVIVSFTIDHQGKINLIQSYSTDEQLRNYVVNELEKIYIKDINTEQTFNLKIVYKVE